MTLSHEVLPAAGEYERFSTAIIDAYVRPAIAAYVQSLKDFLVKNGFKGQLLFIQNNGGIETADVVMQRPSTLVIPGSAAGPATALAIGGVKDEKNLLSVDMGGIDFNIAVISNRTITFKDESLICDHRFSLPVVDIETLGAGGGSIAWFDIGETLHVGPKSAGAYPGPACYGCGGKDATFIDATVILGYISPDYLLNGEKSLRKDLAEKVVKEKVADRLGISIPKAAYTIFKTFNLVMANGVSHAIIKRGYDPRNLVFYVGGATGPLCGLEIAKELGMRKILIPKIAPVYCAFGMLNVDLRHDFSRYYYVSQNDLNLEHVKKLYKEMEAEGTLLLEKENVPENQRALLRTLRMRYYGQFRDLEVSWPSGAITKKALAEGIANFHHKHKSLYGFAFENYPVEFVRFGLTAIGKMPKVTLKKIKRGTKDASSALKDERKAYFEEINGFVKTRVYNGDELCPGNVLDGPCIVDEKMTSIVIPPNFKMCVDEYGNYMTVK